jgi:hypothetical protein
MLTSLGVALARIILSAAVIDRAEKCFCSLISLGHSQSRTGTLASPRGAALGLIGFETSKTARTQAPARWQLERPMNEGVKV